MDREGRSDHRFERGLASVLRAGVLLSAGVVAGGGVLTFARGRADATYAVFVGEPASLRSIGGVLSEARRLGGPGVIQCGVLLLIATPIARVALSVVGFARERDWFYVGVTCVVLVLLLYSLSNG